MIMQDPSHHSKKPDMLGLQSAVHDARNDWLRRRSWWRRCRVRYSSWLRLFLAINWQQRFTCNAKSCSFYFQLLFANLKEYSCASEVRAQLTTGPVPQCPGSIRYACMQFVTLLLIS